MSYRPAVRTAKRAKIALDGPSGSGKTATALRLARGLVGPDGKIAVVDTERGSASLYAGRFGGAWDVDDELPDFSPKGLMERIRAAEAGGYGALVVDSFSHFWMGTGGELEMVDAVKKRSKSGDGFGAWKEVTPVHNELIQVILTSRLHIIAAMRTKTEWIIEQNERGKNAPRRLGTTPIQRDGTEYEFDVWGSMDGASMVVTKTRLEIAPLGLVLKEPGEEFGAKIAAWLAGAPAAPEPAPTAPPAATPANLCAQIAKAHNVSLVVLGEWLGRRGRKGKDSVTVEDVAAWKESCEAEAALRKPAPAPDDRHPRAVHGPATTAAPIDSDDDAPF